MAKVGFLVGGAVTDAPRDGSRERPRGELKPAQWNADTFEQIARVDHQEAERDDQESVGDVPGRLPEKRVLEARHQDKPDHQPENGQIA